MAGSIAIILALNLALNSLFATLLAVLQAMIIAWQPWAIKKFKAWLKSSRISSSARTP